MGPVWNGRRVAVGEGAQSERCCGDPSLVSRKALTLLHIKDMVLKGGTCRVMCQQWGPCHWLLYQNTWSLEMSTVASF